jgi:uncharacterized protein YukE
MKSLKINTDSNKFSGTIDLFVSNAENLNNLLKQIRKIKHIKKAFRVSGEV